MIGKDRRTESHIQYVETSDVFDFELKIAYRKKIELLY